MRRRDVLAAAASAVAGSARAQTPRTLRFIPAADPGALDPTADPRPAVATAALLVWDTLYGLDSRMQPQPQMCAGHEVSDDARQWTFALRPDLRFHDGAAVTARDAVASLRRWMARDRMGQVLAARISTLAPLDDRRFRIILREPFGPLLYALGKLDPPLALILPERLAATDPAVPVAEAIGSGPMRLLGDAGPGHAFARVPDYAARAEGADWLAGGKRMLFERIEFLALSDAVAAAAALQNDAADWWAAPTAEAVPLLKRTRNVAVEIGDPLGRVAMLRLNHRALPFDDLRARQAVRDTFDQAQFLAALTGGDDALFRRIGGIFPPGTPYAETVMPPPGDIDATRRALADAGIGGLPVVVLAEASGTRAAAVVVAQLQRLGFTAEVQTLAAATLALRLAQPDAWAAAVTMIDGTAAATPACVALVADGSGAGGPRAAAAQEAIADWYAATTPAAAVAAAGAVSRACLDAVLYVPAGVVQTYQAWRSSLASVARAPLPLFWNVQKT